MGGSGKLDLSVMCGTLWLNKVSGSVSCKGILGRHCRNMRVEGGGRRRNGWLSVLVKADTLNLGHLPSTLY